MHLMLTCMTQGKADYVVQEDAKYGYAAQRFQPRDLLLCGTCGGIHCSDLRETHVLILERAPGRQHLLVETLPQKGDQSPRFL